MSGERKNFDPDKPPAVGPLATAEWVAAERRWRVSLTPEGTAFVEAALAAYPKPAKLLAKAWPALTTACRAAGFSWRELSQLCRHAALKAATKYDPRHDSGANFNTYWSQWCRGVVARALSEWCRSRRHGVKVLSGDAEFRASKGDGGCLLDFAVARHDPRYDPADRDRADRLRRAVSAVLKRRVPGLRYREIFALRHGLHDGVPLTLEEVGEVFGITRERVRQIENRVLAKVRDELEEVYLDLCPQPTQRGAS